MSFEPNDFTGRYIAAAAARRDRQQHVGAGLRADRHQRRISGHQGRVASYTLSRGFMLLVDSAVLLRNNAGPHEHKLVDEFNAHIAAQPIPVGA